jgi:hypothetical protein
MSWSKDFYRHSQSAEQIKRVIPKGSEIIVFLDFCQGILPYLKDDYNLVDLSGRKIPSLESFENIYHQELIQPSELSKTKDNVLYLINNEFVTDYEKECNMFEHYNFLNEFTIFKIRKNSDNAEVN